ncbi:hypothetical protein BRADI_4g28165v3 [Brachypodium distachyon]|uniref:Uncharacterized protein n=1 Tax=Brachypodium distachyon TaxID=15368 RepID=A0A2K2CQU2_BRADI|nr:hypothetical protein BRADI_4g28165v3 [Brachypodium distachyon]
MSGQPRSPSIPPPQPQPFRFWLPYRSHATSSPRPPLMPASRRPQPPPGSPPPTPAEPAPPRAVEEEDIPIQADSSDESDTIAVEALDALRLRGARQAVADLELTLSRSRPPPNGQEQGTSRERANDDGAKIAISGFPRARLFDGARAPYRREIEDGLKSLAAGRDTPAPPDNQGYRVITLAGHNVGASMVLGSGSGSAPLPEGPASAVATNVNSNVQGVNNSTMEGSSCSSGDPGVRVDVVKKARDDETGVTAPPGKVEGKERPDQEEPARTMMPPQEKSRAGSGGGGAEAARPPTRTRRCLRALLMETRKPRPPTACRFQCVAEHASPAAASDGGGKRAEEGAGESTSMSGTVKVM